MRRQQLQSKFKWYGQPCISCVHCSRVTESVPLQAGHIYPLSWLQIFSPNILENGCCGSQKLARKCDSWEHPLGAHVMATKLQTLKGCYHSGVNNSAEAGRYVASKGYSLLILGPTGLWPFILKLARWKTPRFYSISFPCINLSFSLPMCFCACLNIAHMETCFQDIDRWAAL